MAEKKTHVIVRDGSPSYSEPHPAPPKRPSLGPAEAEVGNSQFGPGYTDPNHVGWDDATGALKAARGSNPVPRHQFAPSKPQPSNPEDLEFLRQGLID